jgi:hypothetical protein
MDTFTDALATRLCADKGPRKTVAINKKINGAKASRQHLRVPGCRISIVCRPIEPSAGGSQGMLMNYLTRRGLEGKPHLHENE